MTAEPNLIGEFDPAQVIQQFASLLTSAKARYGEMNFLTTDNPIGVSIVEYGEWSEIEIDFHCRLVSDDSVILDIGANIGSHTLAYGQKAVKGQVIFFEPQPIMFSLLSKSVKTAGLSNVTGHCAAVSDVIGTVYFEFPNYGEIGNFGMVKRSDSTEQQGVEDNVRMITVDSLELDRCDFIKIDAEGGTTSILAGAANTIEKYSPMIATELLGIEDGWLIMQQLAQRSQNYRMYFYRFAAFNKNNYRKNHINRFGAAEECGMLFSTKELTTDYSADGLYVAEINSLDQLAQEYCRTSKYGDFTPFDRKPEIIGRLYIDLLRHLMPTFGNSVRTDEVNFSNPISVDHASQLLWDLSRTDRPSDGQPVVPYNSNSCHYTTLLAWESELRQNAIAVDAREKAVAAGNAELLVKADGIEDQRRNLDELQQALAAREHKLADDEQKLTDRDAVLQTLMKQNEHMRLALLEKEQRLAEASQVIKKERDSIEAQRLDLLHLADEVRTNLLAR